MIGDNIKYPPLNYGTMVVISPTLTLGSITVIILTILVSWIIISIPIYLAGKIISGKHTTFGKAMVAAIAAPIITLIFFFIVTIGLTIFLGPLAIVIGFIVSIIVLSYVYASIFDTGLLGGFAIAVLGTIITYVVSFIVALLIGTSLVFLPTGFHGGSPVL